MRSKGRPIEQDVELMLNNIVHNPFQVPISLHARSAQYQCGGCEAVVVSKTQVNKRSLYC